MNHVTLRMLSSTQKSVLTQHLFKETMGKMASQAMIVTSAGDKSMPHSSFRGLTISSFSSLALKPLPMVQFNLQVPSFTSDLLHKYLHFAVHILKPNNLSIELARIFSKGAMKSVRNDNFVPTQPFLNLKEDEDYSTFSIQDSDLIIPVLHNAERVLICKKKEVMKVGDHEIWVGTVQNILVNDKNTTGGVLYCNRGFHKLGDPIA